MMEVLQPTPILRSNAPSWTEYDDKAAALRILQEHSGNRQHSYVHSSIIAKTAPSSYYNKNGYPYVNAKQVHQSSHRHKSGYATIRGYSLRDERRFERKAGDLYYRFCASDGYTKYRQRQPKDKKSQDQKWPDNLEIAFFRALVKWKPMGRKKYQWKHKLMGRNELIADEIERLTGVKRTRKQVSSHIQVLKPFVEDDPIIMSYLSVNDTGGAEPYAYRSTNRRSKSSHPVSFQIEPPVQSDTIEPHRFQMLLQNKHEDAFHVYSQSSTRSQQEDLYFNGFDRFCQEYQDLAHVLSERPLDGGMIAMETSLSILSPNRVPKDSSLGIQWIFRSQAPTTRRLKCITTFYEHGKCRPDDPFTSANTDVSVQNLDSQGLVEYQVPFRSQFWATFLHRLGGELQQAEALESQPLEQHENEFSRAQMLKFMRSGVEQSLQNLVAISEIIVCNHDGQEEKSILTIHWRFRKAEDGQPGETTWRRLFVSNTNTPTAVQTSQSDIAKAEPVYDPSLFDFGGPVEIQPPQAQPPTLQSPIHFEDPTHAAVSPAPWTVSIPILTDNGMGETEYPALPSAGKDFTGGHISISYDAGAAIDSFDSTQTELDFDIDAADLATPELAAANGFSQQEYSQAQEYGQAQEYSQTHDYSQTREYHPQTCDVVGVGFASGAVFDPAAYGAHVSGAEEQAMLAAHHDLDDVDIFPAARYDVAQTATSGLDGFAVYAPHYARAQQAYAGASMEGLEVKQEEVSRGCSLCGGLELCTCGSVKFG